MSCRQTRILFGPLLLLSAACASTQPTVVVGSPSGAEAQAQQTERATPHDNLDAVLWQQTSSEYEAVTRQTFRMAERLLEEALADTTWTAALEQGEGYGSLPPAIIADVDETVLTHAVFQGHMILKGQSFTEELWYPWVLAARGIAMPGAREFVAAAHRMGVTVFYVTNHDHAIEPGTRRNLEEVGLGPLPDFDTVLTRWEREEWTSDKSSRRAEVASKYRVLLLLGDDLNDFVLASLPDTERDQIMADNVGKWGRRWLMFPNPMYGNWMGAIPVRAGNDRTQRKLDALEQP
ncbi:MAG: HAD family acid phosphatase [Gemmatimonadota bacterium]